MANVSRRPGLWQDWRRASAAVRRIAETHIDDLDRRIAEMQDLRRTLEHLVRHCRGDQRPERPILDDLADSRQRE